MVVLLIKFCIAWIVGVAATAFLLTPPLIIIFFAIPYTIELNKIGAMHSYAPIKTYVVSLVLLPSLFILITWAGYAYFRGVFVGYAIGCAIAFLLSLGKLGRNPANLSDYIESNASLIEPSFVEQMKTTFGASEKGTKQ
jgi:hypothetical protein